MHHQWNQNYTKPAAMFSWFGRCGLELATGRPTDKVASIWFSTGSQIQKKIKWSGKEDSNENDVYLSFCIIVYQVIWFEKVRKSGTGWRQGRVQAMTKWGKIPPWTILKWSPKKIQLPPPPPSPQKMIIIWGGIGAPYKISRIVGVAFWNLNYPGVLIIFCLSPNGIRPDFSDYIYKMPTNYIKTKNIWTDKKLFDLVNCNFAFCNLHRSILFYLKDPKFLFHDIYFPALIFFWFLEDHANCIS